MVNPHLLVLRKNIIKLKKILIVTYYWPPSGGPGVQRVLKFCKYLNETGWEPIILTVENGDFPVFDYTLKKDVHGYKVYKSKSYSFHKIFNSLNKKSTTPTFQLSSAKQEGFLIKLFRWIRLNMVIPDGRVGWYFDSVNVGKKILGENKIDAIFSSAPPYTTHLIAKNLALSNNLPWIADFRDPWTDRFYNYENKRWWITSKLDKVLEDSVINSAQKCVTVSKEISRSFIGDFKVIHNGYDEEDFLNVCPEKEKENVVIRYIGTMTKLQNPKNFFDVISKLNYNQNKYKVELIGNIHPDVKVYIQNQGFEKFVEIISYVNHSEAIQKMVNSHFLLLVIPNAAKNKGIVTGKLFEYIRSMSKIIMIGPLDGDAAEIINNTSSGRCFDYDNSTDIVQYLESSKYPETINFEKYSRKNLTLELIEILKKMIDNYNK